MAIERITWHITEALLSLPHRLWGKPRIASILTGFIQQIQDLEDAIWGFIDQLDLDNANLHHLKLYARWVNQPIVTEDLELLRALVKTRIQILRSRTRVRDLVRVARTLNPNAEEIKLTAAGQVVYIFIWSPTINPYTKELVELAASPETEVHIGWVDSANTYMSFSRAYGAPPAFDDELNDTLDLAELQ